MSERTSGPEGALGLYERIQGLKRKTKVVGAVAVVGGLVALGATAGRNSGDGIIKPGERQETLKVEEAQRAWVTVGDETRLLMIGAGVPTAYYDTIKGPKVLGFGPEATVAVRANAVGVTSYFVSNDGARTDRATGERKPIAPVIGGTPVGTRAERIIHPACTIPTDAAERAFTPAEVAAWNKANGGDGDCDKPPELRVWAGPVFSEGSTNPGGWHPAPAPELVGVVDKALFRGWTYDDNHAQEQLHFLSTQTLERLACADGVQESLTAQFTTKWQGIAQSVGGIAAENVHIIDPPKLPAENTARLQPGRLNDNDLRQIGLQFRVPSNDRPAAVEIGAINCEVPRPDTASVSPEQIRVVPYAV